ncbi:formate dehydrogenase accessory protein FdhE [Desulforamulus ruminis]|uniref:formate dehydrogenase accessory protein FdhE n=1 Tax=Desulforamulus ruminis TaxID=1564 RepID=UPI002355A34C|nr:formate dehydrogenase accessory protein FdhE [Desulforamulus ruminis]
MENISDNAENLANFYLEILDLENASETLEWNRELDSRQKNLWEQGKAMLEIAPPEMNLEKMFHRFYAVARACRKWQAGPRPLPEEFLQNLESLGGEQRKELIHSLLHIGGNKANWARELGIPLELLDFLALNTFKPLLQEYGQQVAKQLDFQNWTGSHCPVCGDQPTMAKLAGKEGIRKLYCGRCETQWRYKRLGCPYCQDENASQATFISADDKNQYRVYLCDHCKSYLKTVDERICGEVDLFCEDLATVNLDRLAQAEGYQRGDKRQQV